MKKILKPLSLPFVNIWLHFIGRMKENAYLAIITIIFSVFCIGSAIYCGVIGHTRDITVSIFYFLIMPIVFMIEHCLKFKCSTLFMLILYVFLLGAHIGACFNVYTYIPYFDNISHVTFGVFFVLLGFGIMKCFIGEPKSKKQFFACIFFAIGFCMMMTIVWELLEFLMDWINPNFDMQEDTLVHHIHSFILHNPYDHLNTEIIDGIAKTVLYDAQGNVLYTIQGGYLDIGIIDTMCDIFWCSMASLTTCLVVSVDWLMAKGRHVYRALVPTLLVTQQSSASAIDKLELEPAHNRDNEGVKPT